MSHAWKKLRSAVGKLVKEGSQRERLTAAMIDLATLKAKDLPIEIRQEFVVAMDYVCHSGIQGDNPSLELVISRLKDADVHIMVQSILGMYDAVTRYQPIPHGARENCAVNQ
ncbi:MAG: hypothetical protein ACO1NO_07840 [Burkholderiaceae bacterium]